ncbi:MAG: maleylpyruvate isomerase family mycothiol-dependent enzyme [Ilumatobacter sp.]|uniref:maleylpyruvate isomerase family mycothiol-dependent enzyme n=1 Tax=Ilumatobacter sp. TaxID=1967498 RepID=UPI003299734B
MNLDSCLEAIHDDSARIAACAERGELTAPIAACPGWDLRKLVVHTGSVQRWATHALQDGVDPTGIAIPRPAVDASGEELGAWMRLGAGILVDVLAATSPDAETWHPFPAEQKAWVWSRRQAMEAMVHRWDAEVAVDGSSDIDPLHALTGLAEFFEMLLPRALLRESTPAPDVSLHVHCTDDDLPDGTGEWIVWGDGGQYRMEAVHRKGDVALRGPAQALLLAMMGRTDAHDLDVKGDATAATAWLSLPGL